jgi:formylglycine-generating enzyme required for sulfatase activity
LLGSDGGFALDDRRFLSTRDQSADTKSHRTDVFEDLGQQPSMFRTTNPGAVILSTALLMAPLRAQSDFGSSCAGASGATPFISVSGVVTSSQNWSLEVRLSGGIGLGYLLVGFSNTSASALGGLPLPLDLGGVFADPLWNGCPLNVDPSFAILPYSYVPNIFNEGVATFTFPGFDAGAVYMQAINIDPDFVTRIAGVSRGLVVRPASSGFVAIQPSTFAMGSDAPSGSPYFDGQSSDKVHVVTISYPFWIGQHEVRAGEYKAVMGTYPSSTLNNRPVANTTWFDARAYCAALTAAEALSGNVPPGYEYRLPTEAEWEYACRASTSTEFNVGSELLCADARFAATYHPTLSLTTCGIPPSASNVGSFAPNALGLYDMHGNVWEWCLDSYAPYNSTPVTDPFVTGGAERILRGGGFNSNSNSCRSANRAFSDPDDVYANVGFRVVLGPVLVP